MEVNKALALKASQSLVSAFAWSESTEGDEYWRRVADRLEQIAEDGKIAGAEYKLLPTTAPKAEHILQAASTIHATFLWVKTEQGYEYWRQVYRNLIKVGNSKETKYVSVDSEVKKKALAEAAKIVMGNIGWSSSQQGVDYWSSVHINLLQLSIGEKDTVSPDGSVKSEFVVSSKPETAQDKDPFEEL